MNFYFQLATPDHIDSIMQLMTQVKSAMTEPDWFVADDAAYIRHVLNGYGFIVLAYAANLDHLAGFFIIKFPGQSEDNLGHYLDFSPEQLFQCVHMDSAVVHPNARGNHLQTQMARYAEEHLCTLPYRYLLGTIHPDNCYSMNSMTRCGYKTVCMANMYGGLPRAIILKEI